MLENEISVGLSNHTVGAGGLITQADCIGNPNSYVNELNTYSVGCYLLQRDVTTNFLLVVWKNTATSSAVEPIWTLQSSSVGAVSAVKVSLTSAQILALNGTPIQLLAAPSAGTVYQILGVMGRINFLTAAYATNTELDVIDATTSDILFSDASSLLAATSTKVAVLTPKTPAAGTIVTAAGAINAKVATGNPITGAGSVDLYLTYRTVTL